MVAREIETDFQVVRVLKGKKPAAGSFTLHHYRELDPDKPSINGPGLVRFKPGERKQYLMFLVREKDGRYAPVSGQTDPDMSVEELRQRAS